jgi:hypothetical protein
VLKSGFRARHLVQQIMCFSRRGEQDKRPVSAFDHVKETLKLMRSSLPATTEIRQDIQTGQESAWTIRPRSISC